MLGLRRLVSRAEVGDRGGPARLGLRGAFHSRPVLLVAFAFAVMADPVSSVAYAIEAALRALHGNLGLLFPAMALVVAIIALVITNYHQLVARFPEGGGAAAAAGKAFGEGWAFVPIGALIVDFVLTIAISAAAGASAVIDYVPGLASERIPLALVLLLFVAGLTWFGHLRAGDLRRDDARVRRGRRRGAGWGSERAGRERRPGHAFQWASCRDRGAAGVSGCDGTRDRC